MKRWRKYVLCLICVFCIGLLTGCGNDGQTETERTTNAAEDKDTDKNGAAEKNDITGNHTEENGTVQDEAGTEGIVNGITDQNSETNQNSAADQIGDAGADIVDGVGDAGRDVIDGVEDAADGLTGNDTRTDDTDALVNP